MNEHAYGSGEASGKIILLGEHSVVYKKPSIAIPFPAAKIKASITPSIDGIIIDCAFYHGLIDDMPELLESLKETISVSLRRINKESTPLHIKIESSIPAERGMGSSAAASVATTRAIYDYFEIPLPQETLLEIVDNSEKIAHGNPSGLDALMTSSSSPYYYIKGQPFEKVNLNLDAYLIVGDTGKTGQTKEAVESVAALIASADGKYVNSLIDELGLIATDGRNFLESNQPLKLGHVMSKSHQLLRKLGVSSKELDTLVKVALENKAIGAKLTGGGRGGCMIALASDKITAEEIATALKKAGAAQTWLYEMRKN